MKTFYVLEPHVAGTTAYSPDGPNNTREADENEVKHLVDLKVLSTEKPKGFKAKSEEKPKPDYERDGLNDLDLTKADKNQLLVIAAYEGADAPKGEDHTAAELRKAIEAKRKPA